MIVRATIQNKCTAKISLFHIVLGVWKSLANLEFKRHTRKAL